MGAAITQLVQQAMGGDHRAPANVARDQYRHPAQTLRFLGLKPEMTVVEIWPSEGWYTEILAPATRPRGIYYAAGWRKEVHTGFTEKLETRPDVYDHVVVTELSVPERTTIAPPGTADMVLTFRNVHNWMQGDYAQEMFRVFYRTLRPDGILSLIHISEPTRPY